MVNTEELIPILEREFREKRIYGDEEDFQFLNPEKDENGLNCKILINEYYSHGGYRYHDNNAAEKDPTNYIETSMGSVQEAIKKFIIRKIQNVPLMKRPLFRIDLNKPPNMSNIIPLSLSQYVQEIAPRKVDFLKKNPYYSYGQDLMSLAMKRNDIVLDMRENPELTNPQSDSMKNFNKIYSEMMAIENIIIKRHIETNLGEIKHTTYVDDDELLPFYIHQIQKLDNEDFGVFLTSGFSGMPLNVPNDLQFIFNYLEFLITVPPDFPFPLENNKNHEFYWLIEKLIFFIHYIHGKKTFFCHGHTYGNGNPPKPFTSASDLSGFLFQFPFQGFPSYFCELIIPPIKNIHFLQIIPLYDNEMYFALEKGGEELMEIFRASNTPLYINPKRKNLLSKNDYRAKDYGKSGNFCQKCGTIIRDIQSKAKKMKCPNCGAKIKLR